MPYKEKEIKKLYFSVGEVASRVGGKKSTIRNWCKFFDLKVNRNAKRELLFSRRFLHKIRCIAYLNKDMTLQQVKDFVQEGWPLESELLQSIKEKRWRMKRMGAAEKNLQQKSRLLT